MLSWCDRPASAPACLAAGALRHSAGTSVHRVESLDSLRGVAAMVVVLCHVIEALPHPIGDVFAEPWKVIPGLPGWINTARAVTSYLPLRLTWAGLEAVLLFFVLSGYVLAQPFLRGAAPAWRTFAGRRLCRLYLPYLAALFVALVARDVMMRTVGLVPGISWMHPAPVKLIAQQMALAGGSDSFHINGVVWSLVHEIRISLIFPLLMLLLLRTSPLVCLAASFAIAIPAFHYVPQASLDTFAGQFELSLAGTLAYGSFFVLGASAALAYPAFSRLREITGAAGDAFLFLASLVLLNADGSFGPRISSHQGTMHLLEGLGAAGMILLAAGHTFVRRALHWPPLLWVGRVSFSLYLSHYVLFLVLWCLLGPALGIVVTLLTCLPVAALFYRLVEAPTIQLGHRYFGTSVRPDAATQPQI